MGAEPTADSGPGTIEVGDFKIQSGQQTQEQLEEQFKDEIEQDTKDAASKLGKKGARAKKEKAESAPEEAPEPEPEPQKEAKPIKPIPDKKEVKAEESEEESEEEPEDKEEPKKLGKPKHDPRARMLEATRQLADERRAHKETISQIEELREEIRALRRKDEPAPAPKQEGPEKPSLENFENFEQYLDARDSFNKERWAKEFNEDLRRRSEMSAQDQAFEAARQKFATSVGQADGWEDLAVSLVAEFQLPPGQPPSGENWIANELFFNPENAPALGLYLKENPSEFQAIAGLPTPRDVSRAMAKLEARLEAATTGPSVQEEKSKAAPPVRPVKGAAYVGTESQGVKPGESFDSWYKRVGHKTQ